MRKWAGGREIVWGILCVLAVVFFIYGKPAQAEEMKLSGKCGSHAFWSVNQQTKVLTIRGYGAVTERIPLREMDGEGGFINSPYVEKIVIQEGITEIACNRPFLYLGGTKRLLLPDSLTVVGDTAFAGLHTLRKLKLSGNVRKIGEAVFWEDNFLKEIVVAPSNPVYCSVEGVLYSKEKEVLVAYPAGKGEIDGVFDVPSTVREIAPLAFAYQRHVKEIHLPQKLKTLGGGSFYNCSKLKKVNIQDTHVTRIPDYDGWEMQIANWKFASDEDDFFGEDQIYDRGCYHFGTFENTSLKTLELPDAVTEISTCCVSGSKLKRLFLGANYCGKINVHNQKPGYDEIYSSHVLHLNFFELTTLAVSEQNATYKTKDNVLYSKDGTILYAAASMMEQSELWLDPAVKIIQPYAFYGAYWPDTIQCGHSLISIGSQAFAETMITSFQVDGDVGFIQENAFDMSAIEHFTVSGNVYSIASHAFLDCDFLETVRMGGRQYQCAGNAFEGCTTFLESRMDFGLPQLQTPLEPEDILVENDQREEADLSNRQIADAGSPVDVLSGSCGDNVIWELNQAQTKLIIKGTGAITEEINVVQAVWKGVEKIEIQEGITRIDAVHPFSCFHDIRQVELPDSLTRISPFCFYGITQMHRISIPQNVREIGEGAFCDVFCLRGVDVAEENPYFTSVDGVVYSKDQSVLVLYPEAYDSESDNYYVLDSVTEIAPLAFLYAGSSRAQRKIILPHGLRTVGGGAFYGSNFASVNLEDTQVAGLPDYNGWDSGMVNPALEAPQGSTERKYYYWGIFGSSSLKRLVMPDQAMEISTYGLYGSSISELVLGAGYRGTFNQVEKLPDIGLEEDDFTDSFQNSLLLYCISTLREIRISKGNKWYQVDGGLIYDRDKTTVYGIADKMLDEFQMQKSVRRIAPYAFYGESRLLSVTVSGELQSIGEGAFMRSSLRLFENEHTIASIARFAFAFTPITEFYGRGIRQVGAFAFAYTYLDSVNLGDEVGSMGDCVFVEDYMLRQVSFGGDIKTIPARVFLHCDSLEELHYPDTVDLAFRQRMLWVGCNRQLPKFKAELVVCNQEK